MFLHKKKTLAPREAARRAEAGELQLIDVRDAEEFKADGVRFAQHIPLADLQKRIGELDRQRQVAFLCRSGVRSAMAMKVARRHGIDALNVDGGVIAWRQQLGS